jgi:hypothetical protein
VTFEDEVWFDAHRLTGRCVPPGRLDLVAVGAVWCRLLTVSSAERRARFAPDKGDNVHKIAIDSELQPSSASRPWPSCTGDNRYDRATQGVECPTCVPATIEAFVAARKDFYLG